MTNKSIATALTLGFVVFILSVLPVTTADATYTRRKFVEPPVTCFPGEDQGSIGTVLNDPNNAYSGTKYYYIDCYCNPPKTFTGGQCIEKPIKNIGKSKTTGEPLSKGGPRSPALIAALKADCNAKGWRWDEQAEKCAKPEEQSSSERSSDDSDDDYHHKKKKKKRHHD